LEPIHDANFLKYSGKSSFLSHFEHFVSLNHPDKATKIKHQALLSMKSLEGWCSQYKASILIDLVIMTNPEIIVEIGVWGGKSLIPMAFALRENGHGKIYGIDPWDNIESIQGLDGVNKEWWYSVNHKKIYEGLFQKINQFDLQEQVELVRSCSDDTDLIEDINILHIDGNHSEECSFADVVKWVPMVKQGGLIIFSDISWASTSRAVEWLDENCLKFAELKDESLWGIWIKL